MRSLPSWIRDGFIAGLEGGQTNVTTNYEMLKRNSVPMVGVWMQDWVGNHDFPEGVRLLWSWQLNTDFYPDWH